MTELEYRIGVTFMYPDGRHESITVSRHGNDEESSRHAVWHEYKNRFSEVSQGCLITNLIGINLPCENTANELKSENPQ